MHQVKSKWRLPLLLVPILAAIAVAAVFLGGSGSTDNQAFATGSAENHVNCSDIYLDIPPLTTLGDGPGAEDLTLSGIGIAVPIAKSLSATLTTGGKVDEINIVTYLGPNEPDELADKPPSADDCKTKADGNTLNNRLKYAIIDLNARPSSAGDEIDVVDIGGGFFETTFITCSVSEANGIWTRTDVTTISDNDTSTQDFGLVTLYTEVKTPTDLNDCSTADTSQTQLLFVDDCDGNTTAGLEDFDCSTAFQSTIVTTTRAATSDANLTDTDWDGDGCSDWDELQTTGALGKDPFNPEDCDQNFDGVFNLLVTQIAASKNEDGPVPGSYFHCIARIDHDKKSNTLDANAVCYIDSPFLSAVGGSQVPTRADGFAGAPPPPPYAEAAPSKLTGSYDKGTQTITLDGCFADVGGALGPNIIIQASINGKTGKGTVDLFGNQTIAACDSNPPVPKGDPTLAGLDIEMAEQKDGFDHDEDGCSDFNELGHDKGEPPKKCGDDPYNPLDSDNNFNSVGNLIINGVRADWDNETGEVIPGAYFHCIYDNQHDKGVDADPKTAGVQEAITLRLFCYSDSSLIEVNSTAYPDVFGDGLPGDPPPGAPGNSPLQGPYAGVSDTGATVAEGFYDLVTNQLTFNICVLSTDKSTGLGHVIASSTINAHTGHGQLLIHVAQTEADCQAGTPVGPPLFTDATIDYVETAVKGEGYDTDLDGCTDKTELGNNQVSGGLRDPYNRWDWSDQYIGFNPDPNLSNPKRNGSIVVGDLGAVVARFGTFGSPLGDPNVEPTAIDNYHTSADRNGSLPGSNGWNLKGPNGTVTVADLGVVVVQFGHFCP